MLGRCAVVARCRLRRCSQPVATARRSFVFKSIFGGSQKKEASDAPLSTSEVLQEFVRSAGEDGADYAEIRNEPDTPPEALILKWSRMMHAMFQRREKVLHDSGMTVDAATLPTIYREAAQLPDGGRALQRAELQAASDQIFGDVGQPLTDDELRRVMEEFCKELSEPEVLKYAGEVGTQARSSPDYAAQEAQMVIKRMFFEAQWRALANTSLDNPSGFVRVTLQTPDWMSADKTGLAQCLMEQQREILRRASGRG
eukprot:Hpha_TRINITY_DN16629_c3_g10::TRINITY_DN16629_c3_g10_i1::g.183015::m.183015